MVVVIGGGLTGLAAAWTLVTNRIPVTVVERGETLGGLAATFDWDGWKFDYGPHNFHTSDTAILDFYKKHLPGRFMRRDISVRLHIFGQLVNYPLTGFQVFRPLAGPRALSAGLDFLGARTRALLVGMRETEVLDEWIVDRFGRTLYETYFKPYIERVWKTHPHRLSHIIGETKIPVLSIRDHLSRELLRRRRADPEDLTQWEPHYVKHGIGQLGAFFHERLQASDLATIRTGTAVRGLQGGQRGSRPLIRRPVRSTFAASRSCPRCRWRRCAGRWAPLPPG